MATQQTNDTHDETGEQRTQFVIEITPALRRRIEREAARGDLSAVEYAVRLLEQTVPEEEQEAVETRPTRGRPVTQAFVEEMRRTREEWERNHPGVVAEDSVELIRQMREERTEQLERAIKGE